MPSGFLGKGMGPSMISSHRNSDWLLASGTIALANVLEAVEKPANRQLYGGGTASNAWTISFRCVLAELPANNLIAFDAETGRFLMGTGTLGQNGFFASEWADIALFAIGDHTYMCVSDGASIQAYRDGVAIGAAQNSGTDIGGVVRWRSRYTGTSAWLDWPFALRAGHVANVALDATQRAALHEAMMALA